jgi:hypothetical protein
VLLQLWCQRKIGFLLSILRKQAEFPASKHTLRFKLRKSSHARCGIFSPWKQAAVA